MPLFDRVLVERCVAETVTKGGIMLPEKSQGKVLQATVVAVGSGSKAKVNMLELEACLRENTNCGGIIGKKLLQLTY